MGAYVTPVVFLLCYASFAIWPKRRHWVAIVGAAAVLLLGFAGLGISFREAFIHAEPMMKGDHGGPAINWNVMGIFVGTLVVAELFMRSGMPAHLADLIIRRSPSARVAMLAMCGMTSFISIFVENVAAVLIMAPIALALTERLKIRPVAFFVALAVSSNLQGCALLIGDSPSMLLGAAGKMTFNDFIWFHGRPSIFFAVQLGALVSFAVLLWAMRMHRQPVEQERIDPVNSVVPTVMILGLILALALPTFFDPKLGDLAGPTCMVFAVIALGWDVIWHRTDGWKLIRELDWPTTVFLICVFILVGGLKAQGTLVQLADGIKMITGDSLLATFAALIVISMIVSAFVDNVPFLIAMVPVTLQLNAGFGYQLGQPQAYLLLFGLLIGANLGGNISPIGASANIVSMGIMQRRGYNPTFGEFVRIGLPFTILATVAAAMFLWLFWQ
jgi:Na+/H+ antiporter NhaD/arsenite permease-like protein